MVLFGLLLLLLVLNECMGIGFIMPAAQCDLNLDLTDKGLVSSMVFIGIIVSSHFWGYMGDTMGRRFVLLYCLSISSVLSIASALTTNLTLMMVLRFLVGVFVSGTSGVSYPYVGEFTSIKNRTAVISWISVTVGFSSVYLPCWWILSYNWSFDILGIVNFRPWRLLMMVYALPGIIAFIWVIFLPESPRFLMVLGRNEEAFSVIKKIYETNKGTDGTEPFSGKCLQPEYNEQYQNLKMLKGIRPIINSVLNQTMPLMRKPHVRYFLACCFLHFGTFSIQGGMNMWFPEIMNRIFSERPEGSNDLNICQILNLKQEAGNSTSTECNDNVDENVWINGLFLGVVFTLAYIALSALIKPLGRRIIFIFTLFPSGISGILILFVSNPILVITFFTIFVIGCVANVSVINGAAIKVFPSHLRAMSICVSMLCGRVGATIFANLVGVLLDINCYATFYSLAAVALSCGLVSFILPAR